MLSDDEDQGNVTTPVDIELVDFDLPVQSVALSPSTTIRQRKKFLHTLSDLSITTTTSENDEKCDDFSSNKSKDVDVHGADVIPENENTGSLNPIHSLSQMESKSLSTSFLGGSYDDKRFSNVCRRRSASSPRDIDSFFFQSEIDFHCDVYDDTTPDDTEVIIASDEVDGDSVTTCFKDSTTLPSASSSSANGHSSEKFTLKSKQSPFSFNSEDQDCWQSLRNSSPVKVILSPRGGHKNRDSDSGSDSGSDSEIVEIAYNSQENSQREILKDIAVFVVSGILSSITYELLLKIDSNTALVSSFFLHIYIVFFSLSKAPLYLFSSKIPLLKHMVIVFFSFCFIYFKSLAIPLLPMPVFIVCTNLQLVVGLFVGRFLFGKTFITLQYVGVGLITLGCFVITLVSANESTPEGAGAEEEGSGNSKADMIVGFIYMMISIASLSIMIPTGSQYVQAYNADVQEHIFIQHFLSLPLFLMHWETKIFPIVRKMLSLDSLVNDSNDKMSDVAYPTIAIPLFFNSQKLHIPIILIFLVSTTIFANINRQYMIEVSIKTSSLMAQLIGTCTKTLVFLISSLYFNAPPYPPYAMWMGLCIQVIGSYVYVQASFSSPPATAAGREGGVSSFSFRPNTSTNRLSRVSWAGYSMYDSNLLGLSPADIAAIRSATGKHNNRVVLLKHHHRTNQQHSDEIKSNDHFRDRQSAVTATSGKDADFPSVSVPMPVQRTVSEAPMKMGQYSQASCNSALLSSNDSIYTDFSDSNHALPLPAPPHFRQRGKSTADLM